MSGPQSEKVKKELQVLFEEYGLNLTPECNEITVNQTLQFYKWNIQTISKKYKNITISKIHYRTFTKNAAILQTTQKKLQLQWKHDVQISFRTCSRRL